MTFKIFRKLKVFSILQGSYVFFFFTSEQEYLSLQA